MLKRLLYPFVYARANNLGKKLAAHIPSEASVLDVGCGNLLISNELVKLKRVKVQGIDVLDMNMTQLPHTVFDGKTIPFQSNLYDVSILIGVLHHVRDQDQLIKEVKRVTKRTIIIFEDTFKTPAEKTWLKIRDIVGHFPGEIGMEMAGNFKTRRELEALFTANDLVIDHEHSMYSSLLRFTSHTLFVLRIP